MSNQKKFVSLLSIILFIFGINLANAQVLGTYRWNLAPFCNVIKLTVTKLDGGFSAIGSDDQCGLNEQLSTSGSFITLPNNGFSKGVFTSMSSDGSVILITLNVDPNTGNGEWSDNSGNRGNAIFNPATAPGIARPNQGDVWAYVGNNGDIRNTSGVLTVERLDIGYYCVVISKRDSHKAAQVTLADSGGNIVSIANSPGADCKVLITDTHDVVAVFVKTPTGAPQDGNFTILIPQH